MLRFFISLSFCGLLILNSCAPKFSTYSRSEIQYKDKYQSFLEKNSTLVKAYYWYTVEKLSTGKYLVKEFHPDKKILIRKNTFSNGKLTIKNGDYEMLDDEGEILYKGQYINNLKEGKWNEMGAEGNYKADKKDGVWIYFSEKGKPYLKIYYENGKKIREEKIENEEGEKVVEEMPAWHTCKEENKKEQHKCTEISLLRHTYSNIKYPAFARNHIIQGSALVSFVINKEGKIEDIVIRRGLCNEIEKELIKIVKSYPDFQPGKQDGKAVKVKYNLPIRFKLT